MKVPLIGVSADESLALETRQHWQIPNDFRLRDAAPESLAALREEFKKIHPHARPVCSSALYNCGGLVFGSRRVWIDPEHFRQILEDDGYEPVTDPARPGDIVLYGTSPESIDHVGVVHHVPIASSSHEPHEIWVHSQWGGVGEYVHEMSDVPEQFGRPLGRLRFRSCPQIRFFEKSNPPSSR